MIVLENYINSEWVKSSSTETINVVNPANQDVLAKVPMEALLQLMLP